MIDDDFEFDLDSDDVGEMSIQCIKSERTNESVKITPTI